MEQNFHLIQWIQSNQVMGFFVLNPILSDLAMLCELGLYNLEKSYS